jgi:hypothetical protein
MRQNRKSRRGSLMVESSLILLVFMTILIGTFDISQLLFVQQSITERVRVAARYGAVNTYNQAAIENMVLYNQPTVPATGSAAFSLTRSMVTVVRSDAGTPEDRISVTVANFPVEFITPIVARVAQGIAVTSSASYELF